MVSGGATSVGKTVVTFARSDASVGSDAAPPAMFASAIDRGAWAFAWESRRELRDLGLLTPEPDQGPS